jgi:hypothetical protein
LPADAFAGDIVDNPPISRSRGAPAAARISGHVGGPDYGAIARACDKLARARARKYAQARARGVGIPRDSEPDLYACATRKRLITKQFEGHRDFAEIYHKFVT